MNLIQRFWQDETGPELVEWAVVTLILLTSTVAIMVALRDELITWLQSIFTRLEEPPPDSFITQ